MKQVQIAVCTEKNICQEIAAGITDAQKEANICLETDWFFNREDLLYGMRRRKYEIVLVAVKGALGMETAIGAREESPSVPLVWISDEDAFALQSYRLKIKIFLVMPVTPDGICDAIMRCMEDVAFEGLFMEDAE